MLVCVLPSPKPSLYCGWEERKTMPMKIPRILLFQFSLIFSNYHKEDSKADIWFFLRHYFCGFSNFISIVALKDFCVICSFIFGQFSLKKTYSRYYVTLFAIIHKLLKIDSSPDPPLTTSFSWLDGVCSMTAQRRFMVIFMIQDYGFIYDFGYFMVMKSFKPWKKVDKTEA